MGLFADDKVIHLQAPDAAQYGNDPNGANKAKDEALARTGQNDVAQGALNGAAGYANDQATNGRPGAVMNAGDANNQASGANGNQAGAIELARRMAMGSAPSQGAMQMQQGLNQASAQQSAMAAGARGSAAMATAGANRAANVSNMQQNAYSGAGMLRSQDMAAGRGMYASLTGQARDQAGQALGISNGFAVDDARADDAIRLGMGNAAVGIGAAANAENGRDFTNTRNAWDPVFAQDDAKQDNKIWNANNSKTAAANNSEDG